MIKYAASWTLRSYREICILAINAGYYLGPIACERRKSDRKIIYLRHDVDRFMSNAMQMALLERQLGVRSTYYLRVGAGYDWKAAIREISRLGHEVGYHYETMAKSEGNIKEALRLFESELESMRRVAPVNTAVAHGSPLSKWNNMDIWNIMRPADLGVLEPYMNLDTDSIAYFTDTGRSWCAARVNLRDKMGSASRRFKVRKTAELMEMIRDGTIRRMCIQTHPERWSYSTASHARSLAFDLLANSVKLLIASKRS